MAEDRKRIARSPQMKVVSHHPWRRAAMGLAVGGVTLLAALGGYWFGLQRAALDRTYVTSLERLNAANRDTIAGLNGRIVEADLAREVDQEAARALRDSITALRDELAGLKEEVTFYKSLMSPSSLTRGLQIAEFELLDTEEDGQYAYHLLLTQVEARRDWVQGNVKMEVHGQQRGGEGSGELVLPLTEIAESDTYPLKFRFRYFQDLSGVITLPEGFEPGSVVITVVRRGANAADLTRSFEWLVSGREST